MSNALTGSREFKRGMAGVVLAYAALFSWIAYAGKDIAASVQSNLASVTVKIERPVPEPVVEAAPEMPPAEMFGPQGNLTIQPEVTVPPVADDHAALFPAPMDNLYDTTPQGVLPKKASNGMTPFKAYSKPFVSPGKPLIALAVLDYGLSEEASQLALQTLPAHISFILSPYSSDPEKWQQMARERGHEVWIRMPIETENYPVDDPGPQGILSSASLKYNQDRLEWVMSRTPGYAGIAAMTDNAFAIYQPMLQGLMKGAFDRGIGFMELNPGAPPDIEAMAFGAQTPYARNHVFLDTTSLKALEKTAVEKGYVIGVIRPHPNALKAVKTWTDTLAAKNIALAPVSAVTDAAPASAQPLIGEPEATPALPAAPAPASPAHE